MEIKAAQQDVQSTFLRGSVGQTVSGLIWLASAALGTWMSERAAISVLVFVGALIFPLTQLGLRLLGRPSGLPRGHPMNALAMQVAFIAPLGLPVIGAAALYNINWFYPAFMLVLGAHYLPFMFLYGMWEFGVLAALLIGGGVTIGMTFPESFTPGGWFTGVVLLLFAVFVQLTPRFTKQ
ncbi:MAG TPA: hypothetical protein VFY25_06845 [Anaerolineales bacterium]|nr:hypothetical protein [Anaerolineales bacterium]